MEKYRGLIIKSEPLNKILYKGKVWELRGRNFNLKGKEKVKIALIESGTGNILGNCDIVESLGPLTKEVMKKRENKNKHQVENINEVFGRYNCEPYAWVLQNVYPFPEDKIIQYSYPHGAQTWVILVKHNKRDDIFSDKDQETTI